MKHRVAVVYRPVFIAAETVPRDVVAQLVEYVAYGFAVLGLQNSTIAIIVTCPLLSFSIVCRVKGSLIRSIR